MSLITDIYEPILRGPDLLEPHILRSLSNVKAAAAYASHSGCHFVVIDIDGFAWLFGRGERDAGITGAAPYLVLPIER